MTAVGRMVYVLLGVAVALLLVVLVTVDPDAPPSPVAPPAPPTPGVPAPAAPEEGMTIPQILAEVGPGVVAVRPAGTPGSGSGFVVSASGVVVTNAHVLGSSARAEVVFADGTRADAELVGSFPDEDIAVIQVADGGVPEGVTPLRFLDGPVQVGSDVAAIGNALDLGASPTVTSGIVSAEGRRVPLPGNQVLEGLIQTDAAINLGNSGGPLVDRAGRVVGVNTAIATFAQNIGFAIPAASVVPLVDAIVAGGGDVRADQAFLGVVGAGVDEVDPDVLGDLVGARDVPDGVLVVDVVPGSAAAGLGLRPGDVLVAVGGDDVSSSEDLQDVIRARDPGDEVSLRVWSPFGPDGETATVTVTLGTRLGDDG